MNLLRHMAFALLYLTACSGNGERLTSPRLGHFFTEARRQPLRPDDPMYGSVVQFAGCTAFWVRNSTGRHLLMSARHCIKPSIVDACSNGLLFFEASRRSPIAKCSAALIASDTSDLVLLEADLLPEAANHKISTLQLSAYRPHLQQNLAMLGFPGDKDMRGAATKTDNCQVRLQDPKVVYDQQQRRTSDYTVLHNCSTWGGNSGGPMLAAGSSIVLGMPMSYRKDRDALHASPSNTQSPHELARMYVLAYFVAQHRSQLRDLGVAVFGE